MHRENGENGKNNSLLWKIQGIWKFCQSTENFVYPCCEFPHSKDKGYCDSSHFRICKTLTLAHEKNAVGQGKQMEFENEIRGANLYQEPAQDTSIIKNVHILTPLVSIHYYQPCIHL